MKRLKKTIYSAVLMTVFASLMSARPIPPPPPPPEPIWFPMMVSAPSVDPAPFPVKMILMQILLSRVGF